jgi:hypothetical protein
MIKGITSGSTGGYLQVNSNSYLPYVSSNINNPLQGMLRLNGSNLEVYDGSSWLSVGGFSEVSLSHTAITALDWAQKKMSEESRIKEIAAKNVTVADALAKYEEAQDQLRVVLTLTDEG